MTENEYTEREDREDRSCGNRKWFLLPLLLFLIMILILLLSRCVLDRGEEKQGRFFSLVSGSEVLAGEREEMSEEEIKEALNAAVSEGMMTISMNLSPVFEDGRALGTLFITNSADNRYPQVIEIVRNDTEELLYTISVIAIGSRIDLDTLDVPLEKGTYDCTAYFNAVNPDTGEGVGRAAAKITLSVLN